MEMVQPLLRVSGLTKSFEGNVVLDHVDFQLNKGEVHILFGENGAGKSTFTKILCGGYLPNEGDIFIDDHRVNILKPANARELGIIAVHQDFSLIPQMSVIDNLYLGREKKQLIFLSKKRMIEEAQIFLEDLNIGIEINLHERVNNLSMEKQQVVAISRALLQSIKILILDEPTSNFAERETEVLFQQIRRLKSKGIGIIYISHIVEELKAIGDRVTILRDGKVVGYIENNTGITKQNLLKGMVEKRAKKEHYSINQVSDNTSLELKNICTKSGLININFKVNKNEVVGIGGLPDSGKSFIGRTIFGLDKILNGEILLNGKSISKNLSPASALQNEIAYFPAEKLEALVLCRNIKENMSLPSLKTKFIKNLILNKRDEVQATRDTINRLSIKPNDMNKYVKFLSGGNQQKTIIGRGIIKEAKIFILDEITRGVDIASKIDFYQIVMEMAKDSEGIIFITSEISELLDLCNRVIIMYDQKIMAEFSHAEATREKLVQSVLGLTVD